MASHVATLRRDIEDKRSQAEELHRQAEVHTAEADRLEATLALDEAKLLASEALEGRSPPSDTEEGVPHVPPGIYHSSTPIG